MFSSSIKPSFRASFKTCKTWRKKNEKLQPQNKPNEGTENEITVEWKNTYYTNINAQIIWTFYCFCCCFYWEKSL